MQLSHLLFIIPLFLAVACSSTPPSIKKVKMPAKAAPVIKEEFSRILDSNFRGIFYAQGNDAYFKSCGSEQTFSVYAKDALRNIYEQVTSKPSTPVYIEFTGEITFAKKIADKSDVLMRIDHVHHMALVSEADQCKTAIKTFRFKAKGELPYWRLQVNDQNLFFTTQTRNDTYQIQNANFKTTQTNNVKSINKEGERLALTIRPGHCYNLKNKEYWGFTAKIDSALGELKGCGELGWPLQEEAFSGYYLHQTASKVANLTLEPDHRVEYSEKIDNKTSLKTGFWKSNSPDRVVIMLTRQDNNNIREELIFTRKGLTLSTHKINKNNIIRKLGTPGWVFSKMNIKQGLEEAIVKPINRTFTAQQISPSEQPDIEIQKAINQYFNIHRTDPDNTRFSAVKYDLNGDGFEEAIVLLDWCYKSGCEMLIFKGSKDGYRFSSRVSRVLAPITISYKQQYRWQSLLIEKNAQSFTLDFDGISYPVTSSDLKAVDKKDYASEVVLFSQGMPKNWFPIKM